MAIYCCNCGAQLKEGEVFCPECGTRAVLETTSGGSGRAEEDILGEETENYTFCPACGARNQSADVFCHDCGQNLHSNISAANASPSAPSKKKSGRSKVVLTVCAVAILALGAGLYFGLSRAKSPSPEKLDGQILYYKGSSLFRYDGRKMMELTDHLLEDLDSGDRLSQLVKFSEDNRYAFYLKNMDSNGEGDLYFVDLRKQSDKKDTSEKLDSRVNYIAMFSDHKVSYMKDGDNLYVHDLKGKERIASDVENCWFSRDGKNVIWIDSDGTLYHRELKKGSEKEKLDFDVDGIGSVTEDLQTIYYVKEESLYCLQSFEKERVASDVIYIGAYHEGKGAYYMKPSGGWLSVDEVLVDDLAGRDSAMREPVESDYKKMVQYWGRSYYDTDYDAYHAAQEEYQEKLERDRLRMDIRNLDVTDDYKIGDLYCYDGRESSKLLSDSIAPIDIKDLFDKEDGTLYIAYSLDGIELPTVLLSSVSTSEEFTAKIGESLEDWLNEGENGKLLMDGTLLDFELDVHTDYRADTGDRIIYGCERGGGESGKYEMLTSMKYSEKGIESPVTVDEDFEDIYQFRILGGNAYYLKDYDYERGEGALYCNGREIADDVSQYNVLDGAVYLLKDVSQSSRCGTLAKYSGNRLEDIADDVYRYCILKGEKIVALTDYSQKRKKGDLYQFSGNKKEQLDEDVSFIYGTHGYVTN